MKATKINFPKETIKKQMMAYVVREQTNRLIAYAESEIKSIGNDISVAQTRNNLDRTGNLLDSLCFAVYYNGKLQKHGYYRSRVAVEDSALHEWSRPTGESVDGHLLAQNFIAQYRPKENGWEVFFAVLAPYWGYWEKGFVITHTGTHFEWAVMTSHLDTVKQDLAPSDVRLRNTFVNISM